MKKMTLMLLGAVLILSSSGLAAPLNQLHVAAEAKWVIHVDFDAFGESEIWRLVSQEIDERGQKKIDAITNLLGIDLTKDIYGVTICGTDSEEKNAVVMIYGRFDKEKLLMLLALNDAYAESEYNGQKLYHWLDENDNKQKVGIFAADDMIVISQSEQAVQNTVDLLSDQSNSLANKDDAPLSGLFEATDGAIMVMAADGLSELHKDNRHAAILQNSETMVVVVGEDDGDVYMRVDLIAKTNDAAIQIERMLVGIKSFVELKLADDPEIMSVLQAFTLERNENQLSLTFQYSSATLFEMIKAKHNSCKNGSSAEGNE